MPKFKDRIADRYGRLVVLEYAGKNDRNRHTWKCLCDCGTEKVIVGDDLGGGKTKSCGCLRIEFLKQSGNQYGLFEDREKAILKIQYGHLKRRHKIKEFAGTVLTFESFIEKSQSPCKYCGVPFSKELEDRLNESKTKKRFSDTIVKINGIDRVDSLLGYTEQNSVACCKHCNFAKNSMTENEFHAWIKMVYKNLFENN